MTYKLLIKRQIARLMGIRTRKRTRKIILMYHAVGTSPWAMPVSQFRKQMHWLNSHASLRSTEQIFSGDSPDDLQVAITFDDGYACLRDVVAPILKELEIPATVYVNTGWVGESERRASDAALGHYPKENFLSWSDVKSLSEMGWIIGSHGVDHIDLTRETDDVVRFQLSKSKEAIEDRLALPCKEFAYTWGRSTPHVQAYVKSVGYCCAMGGVHGAVKKNSNRFSLPRINVANEYRFDDFRAIVRGDWDYIGMIQKMRK